MSIYELVVQTFRDVFNAEPSQVVRAPGRVNIIGDHTDYNDGFVLPMAIDRAVWVALRPRTDGQVYIHSLDFDAPIEFDITDFSHQGDSPAEYVKGMTWALQQAGFVLNGWEGVMKGDVPIGAGLSSSAALELAIARAFNAIQGFEWQPSKIALLAQRAENKWVGVNSGIMDQMISAAGEQDHALLIDCRSLETESLPLPPGVKVIVMDTGTRRELVTSAYNERRAQCEAAAEFFQVKALRDVSLEQFQASGDALDPVTHRRARHIVTENARVLQARDAMKQGDAKQLGELLNGSHASLRDDFEVSSSALDTIVTIAQDFDGCYGARMTGAGFGGCAVAIVAEDRADAFTQAVEQAYQDATPHTPRLYVCHATNGAEILS